jgi:hypothetical membrane protein
MFREWKVSSNHLNAVIFFIFLIIVSSVVFFFQVQKARQEGMDHIYLPDFNHTSLVDRIIGMFFHNGKDHYFSNLFAVLAIIATILIYPRVFSQTKASTLSLTFLAGILLASIMGVYLDPWPSTGISDGVSAVFGFILVVLLKSYHGELWDYKDRLKGKGFKDLLFISIKITYFLIFIVWLSMVVQVGGDTLAVLTNPLVDNKYGKISHLIGWLTGIAIGMIKPNDKKAP